MRKKVLPIIAVGGALVFGGVLAASLSNVTADAFAVGDVELTADCLNPATANVVLTNIETWQSNTWLTTGVNISITDETNTIACNNRAFRVAAIHNNNQVAAMKGLVTQAGESINMNIPFSSPVPSNLVEKMALSVNGVTPGGPTLVYSTVPSLAAANNGTVTWQGVANATGYKLTSGETVLYEGANQSFWLGQLPNGNYDLQVSALVGGNYGTPTTAGVGRWTVTDGVVTPTP